MNTIYENLSRFQCFSNLSMDRQGQITLTITWVLRVVAAMAAGLLLSINDFNF